MPSLLSMHADDDSYIEDESHRKDYLLSDIGVIWRGTSRHKVPLTWEFGQVWMVMLLCNYTSCATFSSLV